jgi:hypothetical protein
MHNLWGRGYHVESLGDKNVFAILSYISRQDDKHNLRALEPFLAEIDAFLQGVDDARESDDNEVES